MRLFVLSLLWTLMVCGLAGMTVLIIPLLIGLRQPSRSRFKQYRTCRLKPYRMTRSGDPAVYHWLWWVWLGELRWER